MKKQVMLEPLEVTPDNLAGFTKEQNPIMADPDNYDLLCSECAAVVCEGVAPQRLLDQVVTKNGAYLICADCGALSRLPSRQSQ